MTTALLAPAEIDNATRREFLAALAAAGLLAGCATDPAPTDAEPRTRSVEHPFGTTALPLDPQRVAALYAHDLDNALILGLPVVAGGSPAPTAERPFPEYLYAAYPEQVAAIEAVDSKGQLNLEQLAAIAPDAIVSAADFIEPDQYQRISTIAPTATYSYFTDKDAGAVVPWREAFRAQAALFGRDDAAEEWIARFDERVDGLRDRVAQRFGGARWVYVEPTPDQAYLYPPTFGHIGTTLTDEFGLAPAEFITRPDLKIAGFLEVSYERLGEIEADLVVLAGDPRDRTASDALAARPLWASVPAVTVGQVYEIDGVLAFESALAATAFLDVVETRILT